MGYGAACIKATTGPEVWHSPDHGIAKRCADTKPTAQPAHSLPSAACPPPTLCRHVPSLPTHACRLRIFQRSMLVACRGCGLPMVSCAVWRSSDWDLPATPPEAAPQRRLQGAIGRRCLMTPPICPCGPCAAGELASWRGLAVCGFARPARRQDVSGSQLWRAPVVTAGDCPPTQVAGVVCAGVLSG